MADLRFEWDPNKARSNERKHGVTFDEAATAFADEEGLCLRGSGDVIRIISARKADRAEARLYQERLRR